MVGRLRFLLKWQSQQLQGVFLKWEFLTLKKNVEKRLRFLRYVCVKYRSSSLLSIFFDTRKKASSHDFEVVNFSSQIEKVHMFDSNILVALLLMEKKSGYPGEVGSLNPIHTTEIQHGSWKEVPGNGDSFWKPIIFRFHVEFGYQVLAPFLVVGLGISEPINRLSILFRSMWGPRWRLGGSLVFWPSKMARSVFF